MMTKYHSSGLWVEKQGDIYRIGLSEKGQDDVGEIMFVDLPDFKETVTVGNNLIGVEGAKAVTEIVAPFNGKVETIHSEIEDEPELLNSEDKNKNWIIELTNVEESDFNALNDDPWAGSKE